MSTSLTNLLDISNSSAGQIQFPSVTNFSSNAHTLDDYAEGTWTPALYFGGVPTGITYSVQTGNFVRVGRIVTAWGRMTLTSKGSNTGNATIGPLPSTEGGSLDTVCIGEATNITLNTGGGYYTFSPRVVPNDVYVAMLQTGSGVAPGALTNADFANNSTVRLTVVYESVDH